MRPDKGVLRTAEGQTIFNIHDPKECEGRHCCIHNPSPHHMVTWPMRWCDDSLVKMHRVCEHGKSHPDPDAVEHGMQFVHSVKNPDVDEEAMRRIDDLVKRLIQKHDCDGCCRS